MRPAMPYGYAILMPFTSVFDMPNLRNSRVRLSVISACKHQNEILTVTEIVF